MMQLLLIEGVPGAGKTTTAKAICELARNQGSDATWYIEEATEHPIHPNSITRLSDDPDFADKCLQRWQSFVERHQKSNRLHIMEGSAFQSTVRFLMENNHADIEKYFAEFVKHVQALAPALIYLRPNDVFQNSRFISEFRGKQWSDKVSRCETNTPFSIAKNLVGLEGMHKFWAEYAILCDSLLPLWTRPKLTIKFDCGDWTHHLPTASQFLESLGVLSESHKLFSKRYD
jgi:hypothetical protein